MSRTAPGVLAVVPVLCAACGCAPNTTSTGLGPLPEPALGFRPPPGVTRPVPYRRPPAPAPTPTVDGAIPPSWMPAGGIRRSQWTVIVVHHSAMDKATPQSMHAYHLRRGWENGLGYHFVIGNGVNYPDGKIYAGSRWRRQIYGAHCKAGSGRYFGRRRPSGYFNQRGIGVCLIGNFETQRPTRKQLAALQRLIAFLCEHTDVTPDRIYGHSEVTHKTLCPGRYLDMDAVRRAAKAAERRRHTRADARLRRYALAAP